jgi:ATP-dependent Lon protease
MEVIRLPGYILEEKVEIARRYLIPKALRNHGLKPGQVTFRKDALAALIDGWAREAGVRTLENRIKKLMRKAAREFASGRTEPMNIGRKDRQGRVSYDFMARKKMAGPHGNRPFTICEVGRRQLATWL